MEWQRTWWAVLPLVAISVLMTTVTSQNMSSEGEPFNETSEDADLNSTLIHTEPIAQTDLHTNNLVYGLWLTIRGIPHAVRNFVNSILAVVRNPIGGVERVVNAVRPDHALSTGIHAPRVFSCICRSHLSCKCCIHIFVPFYNSKLHICNDVSASPRNLSISLAVTVNGRPVSHTILSVPGGTLLDKILPRKTTTSTEPPTTETVTDSAASTTESEADTTPSTTERVTDSASSTTERVTYTTPSTTQSTTDGTPTTMMSGQD